MTNIIKKIALILTFNLSIIFCLYAQQNNTDNNKDWRQKKEQFKTDHIAFLSTKLELNVEQAKIFWPIFNKYSQQFESVFDERRINFEKYRDVDNISEKDAEYMVNFILENEQKELDIKKKFWDELSQNFPYSLVIKYFKTENEFRRQLIKKARCHGQLGKSYNEKD